MSWLMENKEWLFSGVGLAILSLIIKGVLGKKEELPSDNSLQNSNSIVINNNSPHKNNDTEIKSQGDSSVPVKTLEEHKNSTKILFVDDDQKFKVAKILVKSGWVHTKLIKDIGTLDQQDVCEASILFVDVQGVGVALGFQDEGLGLALALKDKYPQKHVIIYSAETQGDRFHKALRKADSFLPKNADPYEFQKIVEEFTIGDEVS
jgi:hypothetical protein